MKSVLIVSFTDIARDPRVNRQVRFLKDRYRVIVIGSGDPGIEGINYINCPVNRTYLDEIRDIYWVLAHRYEQCYWRQKHISFLLNNVKAVKADVIIANDIDSLPFALKISNGAKIILDAHEYSPREFEDRFYWKLFRQKYKEYLCRRYLPEVDAMMTVCQGIADEYNNQYGVNPLVITNAPDYEEIVPKTTDPQRIRMVYHGGATKSRKIENMIRIMDYVDDRFELDLILVPGSNQYIDKMKKLARRNSRIRFLNPVPMNEVVKFSSHYDIGLFLLEPTNFNYAYALPNKFFEFIQARLAIAIGPSREMARIVKEYDCGIVGTDFSPQALADRLIKLDEEKIDYYKWQSHKIARVMSSERNKEKVLKLMEEMVR